MNNTRNETKNMKRSSHIIAALATCAALLLSACSGTSTESRQRNASLQTTAVAPSAPPQIFVKIDTIDDTQGCCTPTPRHVAKLRWSAPVNDGGAPIIGYDIQVKWNSVEGAKFSNSQNAPYKDWVSCASADKTSPGMFPACTTALTSNATTAIIDSPTWQKSGDKLSQHTVQALDYRVAAINAAGKSSYSAPTQLTCKYGGACEVGDLGPGGGVVYEIAKYSVNPDGSIGTDTTDITPGFTASEVSGADWQFAVGHNWSSVGYAGVRTCPGTSCYTPTPPRACFDTSSKTADIQTCVSKESWHLPFVSPLNGGTEWKYLCNKYTNLSTTWGHLYGSDALMYWSGSYPLKPSGITISLTVSNIISLATGGGATVLADMAQNAYENSMSSTYGTNSAMRFPCSPQTKYVNNTYDSSGRMYYKTLPELGNLSGKLYTDNSVSSLISSTANLSIPIRHFSVSKQPLAPQTAPVLTAETGDGGVRLSWTAGTPSSAVTTALKTAQILPLTDYVIKFRAVGATTWSTLSHDPSVNMSAVIGNGVLTKGTKYEFTVAETNSLGTGPASAIASAVPGPFFQNDLTIDTSTGSFPSVTLQTKGGSGTGAVSFTTSDSAKGCSITGNILAVTSIGACKVTATKASDSDFVAATSIEKTITITKGQQAQITVTSLSKPFDEALTLTSQGGSGDGATTYQVVSGYTDICLLKFGVLRWTSARIGGGTCKVVATKAESANYFAAKSAETNIQFTEGAQAPLIIDQPLSATFPVDNISVVAHGGSGEGAVTFTTTNGTAKNCAVWPYVNTISAGVTSKVSPSNFSTTSIGTGTCIVTATKAADRNYRATTSAPITVTFNKGKQDILKMSGNSIGSRSGLPLATTGGSGTGAVTYSIATSAPLAPNPAKNCKIAGAVLSADSVGACFVTATKAGDDNYNDSAPADITNYQLTRAEQPAITMSMSPTSGASRSSTTLTLSVTGGAGTGAVTYSVADDTATNCQIVGQVISAGSAGTCKVIATKNSDTNYWETSVSKTFTFTLSQQDALSITSLHGEGLSLSKGLSLTVKGGSGTGKVSYTVVQDGSANCSVSDGVLFAKSMGTCVITATKAGTTAYEAITSPQATINFDVRVGDTGLGGGTIVYVADTANTWGRYIEVAPKTWKGTSDPNLSWSDAVIAASKYRGGGKSDWRLPNDAEMAILMKNPVAISGLESAGYMPASFTPYGTRLVRPVRVFG